MHVVPPQEALALLDRWSPITVVRGAQGYGKTTLVGTWLRDQPRTVRSVWLNARRSRGEVAAFGRELVRGFGEAASEDADPLAVLDQVASGLAGDRLVVVIDDAQMLGADAMLSGLVDLVVHHEDLHLVLCSRGRHRVEQLAAGRTDVLVVPPRALLLNGDQIAELAELMGVPLAADQAGALHAAFGGWPAAARLVLSGMTTAGEHLPLGLAEHYLRGAVIPGISDQRTLYQLGRFSLPEHLTLRLVRDFSDGDEPDELLRRIELPGFVERWYDDHDVVLEFPFFIRAILRDQFTEQHPAAARAMHRRLGRWFADRDEPGHPLYALRHAVAGEDWDLFDQLWWDHSTRLALETPAALCDVLRGIPKPVMAARAGLSAAWATLEAAGSPPPFDPERQVDIIRAYAEASRQFAARDLESLPLHDLVYVGTGSFVALRLEGRLDEADRFADRVEAASAAIAGEESSDRMPWFNLQRGITHTLRHDHRSAAPRYHLAWRHRRRTTSDVAAHVAANLALTHALAADPIASRRWLDRHAEIDTTRAWTHDAIDQGAHLAAGLLALDRLDPVQSGAALALLGDGSGPLELWPHVAYLHAQHYLHFGSPAAALAILDAAEANHPSRLVRGEAATVLLLRARADLLLALGQGQQARALLSQHPGPCGPELTVAAAQISLLAGDAPAAARLSASLLWRETTDNRARQDLLVLHAAASHRMGELTTSAALTSQALNLYEITGMLRSFSMLQVEELTDLLANAAETLPPEDLVTLHRHPTPFPSQIELIELTPRERLLVDALLATSSRQVIADQLYVSVNTVRSQLATLYRKLGVNTREQALSRLAALGLA